MAVRVGSQWRGRGLRRKSASGAIPYVRKSTKRGFPTLGTTERSTSYRKSARGAFLTPEVAERGGPSYHQA